MSTITLDAQTVPIKTVHPGLFFHFQPITSKTGIPAKLKLYLRPITIIVPDVKVIFFVECLHSGLASYSPSVSQKSIQPRQSSLSKTRVFNSSHDQSDHVSRDIKSSGFLSDETCKGLANQIQLHESLRIAELSTFVATEVSHRLSSFLLSCNESLSLDGKRMATPYRLCHVIRFASLRQLSTQFHSAFAYPTYKTKSTVTNSDISSKAAPKSCGGGFGARQNVDIHDPGKVASFQQSSQLAKHTWESVALVGEDQEGSAVHLSGCFTALYDAFVEMIVPLLCAQDKKLALTLLSNVLNTQNETKEEKSGNRTVNLSSKEQSYASSNNENQCIQRLVVNLCREKAWNVNESWISRILALFQAIKHSSGEKRAVLVGPSGSGKSCAIQLLADCLNHWRIHDLSIEECNTMAMYPLKHDTSAPKYYHINSPKEFLNDSKSNKTTTYNEVDDHQIHSESISAGYSCAYIDIHCIYPGMWNMDQLIGMHEEVLPIDNFTQPMGVLSKENSKFEKSLNTVFEYSNRRESRRNSANVHKGDQKSPKVDKDGDFMSIPRKKSYAIRRNSMVFPATNARHDVHIMQRGLISSTLSTIGAAQSKSIQIDQNLINKACQKGTEISHDNRGTSEVLKCKVDEIHSTIRKRLDSWDISDFPPIPNVSNRWLWLDGDTDEVFSLIMESLIANAGSATPTFTQPDGQLFRISPEWSVVVETGSIAKWCPSSITRCSIINFDSYCCPTLLDLCVAFFDRLVTEEKISVQMKLSLMHITKYLQSILVLESTPNRLLGKRASKSSQNNDGQNSIDELENAHTVVGDLLVKMQSNAKSALQLGIYRTALLLFEQELDKINTTIKFKHGRMSIEQLVDIGFVVSLARSFCSILNPHVVPIVEEQIIQRLKG